MGDDEISQKGRAVLQADGGRWTRSGTFKCKKQGDMGTSARALGS